MDPPKETQGRYGGLRIRRPVSREDLFVYTGYAFTNGEQKPCRARFWELFPKVFYGRPNRTQYIGSLDGNTHSGLLGDEEETQSETDRIGKACPEV